jgi:hypothetical protein
MIKMREEYAALLSFARSAFSFLKKPILMWTRHLCAARTASSIFRNLYLDTLHCQDGTVPERHALDHL